MSQTFLSKDIPIPKLIRSKRRSIALEISPDGTFIVRAPHFVAERTIREFISRKRKWIDKIYDSRRKQLTLFRPKQFIEGESFLYLGNEYPLHIAPDMHGKFLFEERFILHARYLAKARLLFERWYKDGAFMGFTLKKQILFQKYGSVL